MELRLKTLIQWHLVILSYIYSHNKNNNARTRSCASCRSNQTRLWGRLKTSIQWHLVTLSYIYSHNKSNNAGTRSCAYCRNNQTRLWGWFWSRLRNFYQQIPFRVDQYNYQLHLCRRPWNYNIVSLICRTPYLTSFLWKLAAIRIIGFFKIARCPWTESLLHALYIEILFEERGTEKT